MAKCAKGEDLRAPWGYIQFDMGEENGELLDEATRQSITRRMADVRSKRLCLEHWLEALTMIEEFAAREAKT